MLLYRIGNTKILTQIAFEPAFPIQELYPTEILAQPYEDVNRERCLYIGGERRGGGHCNCL